MSGLLAGKVWHSDLAAELKPLAATLADIGDDDGSSIYPSIDFVAWRLGRSRASVDRGLRELREMGVLVVVSQGGGRYKTTEYEMVEEKLPKRAPWKPRQDDVVKITTSFEQETTSPVSENHVTAMTHDPSLPVIDPSEDVALLFPKPQKKKERVIRQLPTRIVREDSVRTEVVRGGSGEGTGSGGRYLSAAERRRIRNNQEAERALRILNSGSKGVV